MIIRRLPRRIVFALAALLLGGGVALVWMRLGVPDAPRAPLPVVTAVPAPSRVVVGANLVEPAYSPLADELLAARFDAAHDVEVLRGLIGQFTTTLRLAERPPLGDNADLVAALTGANRRRLVFVPPGHPALREGLLVDRWGTPFHFHARSADVIDVRSAGPDRVLFTADDLANPAPAQLGG